MINLEKKTLLEVRNLSVHIEHPNQNFFAIRDIFFNIQHGETLALVGESGSGKTMTALALMNLLPKWARVISGEIKFKGEVVAEAGKCTFERLRGKHVAMIFQEAQAALNPAFCVGTQIADVIQTHLKMRSKAVRKRVLELLKSVGFTNPNLVYKSYPHQLSGGMAQRVMIAMALSCHPELIIADEPTTSLDVTTQLQILKLIKNLQKEYQFALLLISHDIGLVSALADSILVMKTGNIIERGDAKLILTQPHHSYTRTLINSVFHIPAVSEDDGHPCQVEKYF